VQAGHPHLPIYRRHLSRGQFRLEPFRKAASWRGHQFIGVTTLHLVIDSHGLGFHGCSWLRHERIVPGCLDATMVCMVCPVEILDLESQSVANPRESCQVSARYRLQIRSLQLEREGSPPPGLRLPQAKLSRNLNLRSPRTDSPVRVLHVQPCSPSLNARLLRELANAAAPRTVPVDHLIAQDRLRWSAPDYPRVEMQPDFLGSPN
jgi:hypothetical protein